MTLTRQNKEKEREKIMKKNLNKLATLALTGAIVAGMSFGAFADEVEDAGQNQGQQQGTNYTVKNSFSFDKYLKIAGGDNVSVPHVTFSFTAKPYDMNKPDDELLNTAEAAGILNVYNGVTNFAGPAANRKVTGKVTFSGAEQKKDGAVKNAVSIKCGDTDVAFTHAGIYRYTVEEVFNKEDNTDFYSLYNRTVTTADENGKTTETDQSSVKTNTNDVKYIDVYVQYDQDSKSYKVTNVVLMASLPDKLSIDEETGKVNYAKAKLAGVNNLYSTKHDSKYVPSEDDDAVDNAIILTKKLGETGFTNKSDSFRFTISFNNIPDDFVVTYAKKGAKDETYGEASTWSKVEASDVLAVELKADESVKITGIPVGINYTITEEENANYEPSYADEKGNALTDGNENKWDLANQSLDTDLVSEIVCTNTHKDITVTGVAMNIAPYAAMVLGAGAFAGIFLGGKRRKAEDED
jgi:hypothetical protein